MYFQTGVSDDKYRYAEGGEIGRASNRSTRNEHAPLGAAGFGSHSSHNPEADEPTRSARPRTCRTYEVICPLLSGPEFLLFWIMKEFGDGQEAPAEGDYRQAA